MTKREAIAWLEKKGACPLSMRRMRRCATVKQMLGKATTSELVWAVYSIGGKTLVAYGSERDRHIDLPFDEYTAARRAIAGRILRAWVASR